jgi:uncharacterized phage infection (PIP) family protein YhgE
MQNEVIQAAVQVETSKLLVIILLLTLPQLVGMVVGVAVLYMRSRTKITEQNTVAQIDERAKREQSDLDERKRFNDNFNAVLKLWQEQHEALRESLTREAERQRTNDAFQKSYLEVAQTRTEQLNDMRKAYEDHKAQVAHIEEAVQKHREAATPAIEIVKELPTTLERIEKSLKQLDEQLKAIPAALKIEIQPLMETVTALKNEVQELTDEAMRVTQAIAPLIAPSPTAQLNLTPDDMSVIDIRKTPPPGTLKAIVPPGTPGTPPFDPALLDTTGSIQEATPQ